MTAVKGCSISSNRDHRYIEVVHGDMSVLLKADEASGRP